jgi:hypothetical protein
MAFSRCDRTVSGRFGFRIASQRNMSRFGRALAFSCFFSVGITATLGPEGVGVLGRLILADLLLAGLIAVAIIRSTRVGFRLSPAVKGIFVLVLCFLPGVIGSDAIVASAIELLIVVFLGGVFWSILQLGSSGYWFARNLSIVWIRAASMLAVVGICDLIGVQMGFAGLDRIFSHSAQVVDGLVGTFRNTGQSGAFFGITFLFTLFYWASQPQREKDVGLHGAVMGIALLLSLKRAAIIGGVIGVSALAVYSWSRGDRKRTRQLALAGLIIVGSVGIAVESGLDVSARFDRKYSAQGVSWMGDFLKENVESSVAALAYQPITGVGLAGVEGVYQELEVHSTYLKVLSGGES